MPVSARIARFRPAAKANLLWLQPNLEGLLIRLHKGYETREIHGKDAFAVLHRIWPSYEKSVSALELQSRFNLDDLKRAARHDDQLKRLLEVISLA